jgi:hypothetical protein
MGTSIAWIVTGLVMSDDRVEAMAVATPATKTTPTTVTAKNRLRMLPPFRRSTRARSYRWWRELVKADWRYGRHAPAGALSGRLSARGAPLKATV